MPKKLRAQLSEDPYYHFCIYHRSKFDDGKCDGRVTWEHCWTYDGKQIQKAWAIVPLCYYHHLGEGFNKEIGRWASLNRATTEDLAEYPRTNFLMVKDYLNRKFGLYNPEFENSQIKINYSLYGSK